MTDWTLLGSDPAPGDPALIGVGARSLDQAAQALREADGELGRIARGAKGADLRGCAADALDELIRAVRTDLDPIASSFERVGGALAGYGTTLADLQAEARRALARATVADQRRCAADGDRALAAEQLRAQSRSLATAKTAQRSVDLQNAVDARAVIDPGVAARNAQESRDAARRSFRAQAATDEAQLRLRGVERRLADAEDELERARADGRSVHERWDDASHRAARQVDGALADALRNRSMLEKAVDRVRDVAGALARFIEDPGPYLAAAREHIETITNVLSKLATALSIAAKLLAIVPGLQQFAAMVQLVSVALSVLELALQVVSLAFGVYLMATSAKGRDGQPLIGWGDLAFDAIGVGVGFAGMRGKLDPTQSIAGRARKEAATVARAGKEAAAVAKAGGGATLKSTVKDIARDDGKGLVVDKMLDASEAAAKRRFPSAFRSEPRRVSICVPHVRTRRTPPPSRPFPPVTQPFPRPARTVPDRDPWSTAGGGGSSW